MYAGRYTETFLKRLKEKAYSQIRTKVREKCEMILQHPRTACRSEQLKHTYRGKRSARLDDRYRIIYTICEECHRQGLRESNLADCPECENVPMETVTFLDITDHYRK